MKKLNSILFGIFMMLVCVLPFQSIFAVDVPLKKGEPGAGTLMMTRSLSIVPVTADLLSTELIVDFTSTVGTAYVSLVDKSGNVVYQTTVDTFSTPEVVIPVDGLNNGNYALKIVYGSTSFSGSFKL